MCRAKGRSSIVYTRWAHAKGIFSPWWAAVNLVWFALSSADTLVSKYGSDALKSAWNSWWVKPKWGWKVWAIGFAVSTLASLFEYSYRSVRFRETELSRLRDEVHRLSTQPMGPEMWLRLDGHHIGQRSLMVGNVAGGTARDIQLQEMTDGELACEKSDVVPFLDVGQWNPVICAVHPVGEGPESVFTFSMDSFLTKAKQPVRASVRCLDANGTPYTTVFELKAIDSLYLEVRQVERRRH